MNKKVAKKQEIYDDEEDLEIKKVAYFKGSSQVILLLVLILLFGFTLFNSLMYIGKYYNKQKNLIDGNETIEINKDDKRVFIVNSNNIDEKFTQKSTNNEDKVITNISSILLETDSDSKSDGIITYDVKYNITQNNFVSNLYSQNDSVLRVRFAYSYNNKDWIYITNAISTNEGALTPVIGNYYDISGLVTTLKIASGKELRSNIGEKNTVYWKSETLIKNSDENLNKEIQASFKIEYKE